MIDLSASYNILKICESLINQTLHIGSVGVIFRSFSQRPFFFSQK